MWNFHLFSNTNVTSDPTQLRTLTGIYTLTKTLLRSLQSVVKHPQSRIIRNLLFKIIVYIADKVFQYETFKIGSHKWFEFERTDTDRSIYGISSNSHFGVIISRNVVKELFEFIQLTWSLGNVDEIYGSPILMTLLEGLSFRTILWIHAQYLPISPQFEIVTYGHMVEITNLKIWNPQYVPRHTTDTQYS